MPEITDDPAPLADIVRDYILAVCERCNWNLNLAAGLLGVALKTVYNRLHVYEQQGYVTRVKVGQWIKRTAWERRAAA